MWYWVPVILFCMNRSHNFSVCAPFPLASEPCVFWQRFCKFLTFDMPKPAPRKMHVNWHTQFRILDVVWLVKKKTSCWKLELRVLLGMWHWGAHFKRKCKRRLTIGSCFLKCHVTLWIEVECEMKFTRSKKPQESSKYYWSRANFGPKEFTLP